MSDPGSSRAPGHPERIRIVLDHTTHPGNIGATARAMKVMGLSSLHLVAPRHFPDGRATALAAGADDLLAGASIHAKLIDALAGCTLVFGTSDRQRAVPLPLCEPRDAARQIVEASRRNTVAVVFGPEATGLHNDALDHCHALIRIPTAGDYQSLNLAQAVQVICYEILMALRDAETVAAPAADEDPADPIALEVFFQRLERALRVLRFSTPGQTRTLHRRLRRIFLRARPSRDELNLLQGIVSRMLELNPDDETQRRR
ncbi:MAG: tRNA (cytosine(32)/uridine(32)-2'-O)-methyltransferase TrmJ [Wenzhouxiangellaceae bacterium]